MDAMKDKTAIVGVGYTKYSKNSGVSVLQLATEACKNAIEDAGLSLKEIDGITTFAYGDSVPSTGVTQCLGIPKLRYFMDYHGGGYAAGTIVIEAAMAVYCGLADYVVCFRALNGRSAKRIGSPEAQEEFIDIDLQFMSPFGVLTAPHQNALWAARHMLEHGITSEQLGQVAVSLRKHASLNPNAIYQTPITIEDHQNSRVIVWPFHLYDCCAEVDGGCAVVVTTAERARDLKHRPVYMSGMAVGGGPRGANTTIWTPDWNHDETYADYIAPDLYKMAGVTPADIDCAQVYDCFTTSFLQQIEGFGFCKTGESGSFVEGGRIELGGELPCNTSGGLLSEGYLHGLNLVVEGVVQVRGEAGDRQVKNCELCLVTAGGDGDVGSALILRR